MNNTKICDYTNEESICFSVKTTAVVNGLDILNGKEEVHITVTGSSITIEAVRMVNDTESKKELMFSASKGQLMECNVYDAEADKKKQANKSSKKK
ncbi:TPA: hypothetical protein RQN22_001836 [Aeromonas dhakensis]|nr:hypothetical protein [Aeromonas dhakensis]